MYFLCIFLKKFYKIRITCDEIEKIPQKISHLESIIKLYFDSCNIQRFPKWIMSQILYLKTNFFGIKKKVNSASDFNEASFEER